MKIQVIVTQEHVEEALIERATAKLLAICCPMHQALRPLLSVDDFTVGRSYVAFAEHTKGFKLPSKATDFIYEFDRLKADVSLPQTFTIDIPKEYLKK